MPHAINWHELPSHRLQEIIKYGDAEQRERARREQQRREQRRQSFVRGLDDEELAKIVTASPHSKLGRFLGRALDEGIRDLNENELVELAEAEQQHRERAREQAKQQAAQSREPFRVI